MVQQMGLAHVALAPGQRQPLPVEAGEKQQQPEGADDEGQPAEGVIEGVLLVAVGHPLNEEAREQHQQQGTKLPPDSLYPLFGPAEVVDQDPFLQSEVARHHQGQQQEPDLAKPPAHRHREGILPDPLKQAAHHQHHGRERQRGDQGTQQQATGEAELVLGDLADARCHVFAEADQMAGQLEPAPGQHQQAEAGHREGQGIVLGDGAGQLQPVVRVEGQRQGGGDAEDDLGGEGAHVR